MSGSGRRILRLGIVVQGGMYNGTIRALQRLGLADLYGNTEVPLYVLERDLSVAWRRVSRIC